MRKNSIRLFLKTGKTVYSKKSEQKLFFILTIAMLIAGILYKTGFLGQG